MDENIIKQIFLQHGVEKVKTIQKIEIGFTNKIYSINNKFIFKVCEKSSNEDRFSREAFLYEFFKNKIPVPEIILFDNSKKIYDKFFMIYSKIQGDNLYSKWHLINDSRRKDIIKQFCDILRKINESSYKEYTKRFKLSSSVNWHDKIINQTRETLKIVKDRKLLSSEFIGVIKKFIDTNHQVLNEQKIALTYWDAHFDNILVKKNKIVGILDFEGVQLSSIDYVLGVVKKMAEYPKKFMSEKMEKLAKKKDYSQLMVWFREFYPELFDFRDIDRRLDLYYLKYDLHTLLGWPNSKQVKQMIAKTVKYNDPTF